MYKRARSYSKYAPVAVTSSVHQTNGQQGIWLKGREFLFDVGFTNTTGADITGGCPYVNTANVMRPTDYSVFTWLASIARKFNNYKFRHMALVYEPTCSSTMPGSVGMYFDPDPSNTGPANWSAFVNTGANTHGAPWVKHGLVVPYRDFADRKEYYTKDEYPNLNAPSQPVIDPLEHYPGIYGVVLQGITDTTDNVIANGSTVTCGKIYLEYAISLWKSMSDSPPVNSISQVALNPATALNSGVGMVTYIPDQAAGLTGIRALLGTATGATSIKNYSWAGFGYFNRDITTYALTTIQNVELHYDIAVTGNAGTIDTLRFIVNGTSYDPAVGGSVAAQEYRLPAAGAALSIISVGRLRLRKGDTFAIICTSSAGGGDGVKNYYISLTPSVYGIYA